MKCHNFGLSLTDSTCAVQNKILSLTGCTAWSLPFSSSQPHSFLTTMGSQQSRRRESAPATLIIAIDALNLARELAAVTPARAVFGSVSVLLTMIRVSCPLFCIDGLPIHVYLGLNGE